MTCIQVNGNCNIEYFQVRYDSRIVIYERKMFIRLATGDSSDNDREQRKKDIIHTHILVAVMESPMLVGPPSCHQGRSPSYSISLVIIVLDEYLK